MRLVVLGSSPQDPFSKSNFLSAFSFSNILTFCQHQRHFSHWRGHFNDLGEFDLSVGSVLAVSVMSLP
ncbi:MAG: hypothetical protein R2880_09775 [Deinococcales bacterium]